MCNCFMLLFGYLGEIGVIDIASSLRISNASVCFLSNILTVYLKFSWMKSMSLPLNVLVINLLNICWKMCWTKWDETKLLGDY